MDGWKQIEVIHCPNKECKGMLLSNDDCNYNKCSNCEKEFFAWIQFKEIKK